jgi:hypothetical protein
VSLFGPLRVAATAILFAVAIGFVYSSHAFIYFRF